jgi:hypothetical protein
VKRLIHHSKFTLRCEHLPRDLILKQVSCKWNFEIKLQISFIAAKRHVFFLSHFLMYGSNTSPQYFQISVEVSITEFKPVTPVFIRHLWHANGGKLEAAVNLQAYTFGQCKQQAS